MGEFLLKCSNGFNNHFAKLNIYSINIYSISDEYFIATYDVHGLMDLMDHKMIIETKKSLFHMLLDYSFVMIDSCSAFQNFCISNFGETYKYVRGVYQFDYRDIFGETYIGEILSNVAGEFYSRDYTLYDYNAKQFCEYRIGACYFDCVYSWCHEFHDEIRFDD